MIRPSGVWYEERVDFSKAALGSDHSSHKEIHGYELLQGTQVFEGELLGGCLESMYDMLESKRYKEEGEICRKYHIFPKKEEWKGKIVFLETCEEKPSPELLFTELQSLERAGVFEGANGMIVGKPQDEQYYEEYKKVYLEMFRDKDLPILYNVNVGHALPRAILPYGARVRVDAGKQEIVFL